MLILRSSPASPFGRKVKIAAAVLGLMDRIEIVAADTNDPDDALRQQNPLGKIPTLVLEDGTTLFDSRVIVDYLDHLAGGGRIIPAGDERFDAAAPAGARRRHLDAALLQVYEGRFRDPRTAQRRPGSTNQAGKVARALAVLEAAPPGIAEPPRIGEIALACALGYLDLRFAGDMARRPSRSSSPGSTLSPPRSRPSRRRASRAERATSHRRSEPARRASERGCTSGETAGCRACNICRTRATASSNKKPGGRSHRVHKSPGGEAD